MSTKRIFTMSDAVALPVAVDVAVHPQGLGAAYVLQTLCHEGQKFCTDIWWAAPDERPRQLTQAAAPVRSLTFSPDGKWLAFLSNRSAPRTAHLPNRSLVWLLPLAGGEAFPVTFAEDGVAFYEWSADSQTIYYGARQAFAPAERYMRSEAQRAGMKAYRYPGPQRPTEIWAVSRDGSNRRKIADGDRGLVEFSVSPSGRFLAYIANGTGLQEDDHLYELWLVDLESRSRRRAANRPGAKRLLGWSPDEQAVAFRSGRVPQHTFAQQDLFTVPTSGDEPVNQTLAWDGDVAWARWRSPTSLVVALAEGPKTNLYELTGGERHYVGSGGEFSLSPDGRWLACLSEDAEGLPEVDLYDLQLGKSQRLTNHSQALQPFQLPVSRVIHWQGEGDQRIEGILTLPEGPGPYPLMVMIHGGPHVRARTALHHSPNIQTKVYASHGYAVFQPNYRGSAGYGNDFAVALYRDIGGIDYRDIMAGVDHLVAEGIADPDRLYVNGRSYGGYLVNWIITQTSRFQAAVSRFGIWNLAGDYGNTREDLWQIDYSGAYYWEDPEFYRERSPSTYVTNIETPVLIMHGEEDHNVFISNSQEMWHALHHLQRTVEFVRYPGEAHGFQEPAHQIDEVERVLRWFARFPDRAAAADAEQSAWLGHTLTVGTPRASGSQLAVPLTIVPNGTLSLRLSGHGHSDVLFVVGDREVKPLGLLTEGNLVIKGSLEAEISSAATLTVVLEATNLRGELTLHCLGFPAIKLSVPEQLDSEQSEGAE